jgi:glycosyltransferase involved in cell wall biosynthesis
LTNEKAPWVLVSGDFTRTGGMDRANYHLAWYLADRLGHSVHLVAYRVAEPLVSHPNVVFHRVARPLGSHALGEMLLRRRVRQVASELTRQDARTRVVVNGGNGDWPDINWVHMVHHASACQDEGAPWWFRLRNRWSRRRFRIQERQSLWNAKLVIANSDKTQNELLHLLELDPARVRRIYLGVDPDEFSAPQPVDRAQARLKWNLPADVSTALFVGVVGYDRNKGLDTLLSALQLLQGERPWLVLVAGNGALPYWQRIIDGMGLTAQVRLLGHTSDVRSVMAAADVLISPTRYDSYGLAVHEANCRGLPAIASRCAGVAERYPPELRDLVLDNPNDAEELASRMRLFVSGQREYELATHTFGARLRAYTWDDMAAEIYALANGVAQPASAMA